MDGGSGGKDSTPEGGSGTSNSNTSAHMEGTSKNAPSCNSTCKRDHTSYNEKAQTMNVQAEATVEVAVRGAIKANTKRPPSKSPRRSNDESRKQPTSTKANTEATADAKYASSRASESEGIKQARATWNAKPRVPAATAENQSFLSGVLANRPGAQLQHIYVSTQLQPKTLPTNVSQGFSCRFLVERRLWNAC